MAVSVNIKTLGSPVSKGILRIIEGGGDPKIMKEAFHQAFGKTIPKEAEPYLGNKDYVFGVLERDEYTEVVCGPSTDEIFSPYTEEIAVAGWDIYSKDIEVEDKPSKEEGLIGYLLSKGVRHIEIDREIGSIEVQIKFNISYEDIEKR